MNGDRAEAFAIAENECRAIAKRSKTSAELIYTLAEMLDGGLSGAFGDVARRDAYSQLFSLSEQLENTAKQASKSSELIRSLASIGGISVSDSLKGDMAEAVGFVER